MIFVGACGPDLSKFSSTPDIVRGQLLLTIDANKYRALLNNNDLKYPEILWGPKEEPIKTNEQKDIMIAQISVPDEMDPKIVAEKLISQPGVLSVDPNYISYPMENGTTLTDDTGDQGGSEQDVRIINGREIFASDIKANINNIPSYLPNDPLVTGSNIQQYWLDLIGVPSIWYALYFYQGLLLLPEDSANYAQQVNGDAKDVPFQKIIEGGTALESSRSDPQYNTIGIAVIDNGFDLENEDMAGQWLINVKEAEGCYNESTNTITGNLKDCNNGKDEDGNGYRDDIIGTKIVAEAGSAILYEDYHYKYAHGTHVAGIISSLHNNDKGGAGICPTCRVLPVNAAIPTKLNRIVTSDEVKGGNAPTMNLGLPDNLVIKALNYIVYFPQRVDIINLSIGKFQFSRAFSVAIDKAAKDTLIVAAAGNEDTDRLSYPAADSKVLGVSAIGGDGTQEKYYDKVYFSNFGNHISISAPGASIGSIIPEDCPEKKLGGECTASMQGTSQAAPIVAGVVGLIWSIVLYNELNGPNARASSAAQVPFSPEYWKNRIVASADRAMYSAGVNYWYQSNQGGIQENTVVDGYQYLGSGLVNAVYALLEFNAESIPLPEDTRRLGKNVEFLGCSLPMGDSKYSSARRDGFVILIILLMMGLIGFCLKSTRPRL